MMRDIFLTGCNGYIGSRLVPALITRGAAVTGIDRAGEPTAGLRRFIPADLLDPGLSEALAGCDTVIHLAAAKSDWGQSEEEYFRDNVEATRRLLDAGRTHRVRNWVFFSSVAAMGAGDRPRDETAPLRPVIPYGRSKAEAEQLFRDLAAEVPDARIAIVRPSVVYGPENPDNTNVFRLIDAIHRGRFVMVGDGNVIKTTSYVGNLTAATLFLLDRLQPGAHAYIAVDDPKMKTIEMTRRIHELLGRPESRFRLPVGVAAPLALASDGVAALLHRDLPITSARIRKFCRATDYDGAKIRALGFRQPFTNDEALRDTVAWYVDRYRPAGP